MDGSLPPACRKDLEAARDLFLETPGRWRVVYHNDGDGVASASVLANALNRMQKGFQMTPFTEIDQERMRIIMRETHGPLLVVDTGSSMVPLLSTHEHTVIILDHHLPPEDSKPTREKFLLVNPHPWGVDGMTELSASMLSYLFSMFLDPNNVDLVPWGLSGAIADRQHVGGFQGLNQAILNEAEKRGQVAHEKSLSLFGTSLDDALAFSVDPYIVGISGHHDKAKAMLSGMSLDWARTLESLTVEEKERLAGALVAKLISQGARPEFCERVSEERYRFPRQKQDALTLSLLQNATARENESSLGIALALGDQKALAKAMELEKRWRAGIIKDLSVAESAVQKRNAIQWFRVPEASLGGTVAGFAINYFLEPTMPVVAISTRGSVIKVSARGTRWLVSKGLDLNMACREAASAVKGEGGGHKVASGATIPPGSEERFLDIADKVVGEQLRSLRA